MKTARALVAAAAVLAATAAPATGAAPRDPECLALAAGSTGLLAVGGSIPSEDQLAGRPGGLGDEAPAVVARTLPDRVAFRTAKETFSNEYAFALRDGRVYVRRARQGVGDAGEPWRVLELPACLDGHVREISADHRLLIALGRGRQLYSHDMPGGDLSAERWTWRWGPYFWTGAGMRMFEDVRDWATSEFTSGERFTDTAGGERAPIGVATVYLLRGDGTTITYLDPWLPADESREVCGPRRGTVRLAGLSGSGSTVFAVSRRGALYTRLYDFDVSGANTVFGSYSWETDRPADDPRWQLPGPGWVRHRRPPGTITDRISISKSGDHARDRVLRVEGRSLRGRRGYWQKRIDDRRWRFVRTRARLAGRPLPLRRRLPRLYPQDRRYVGTIAGTPAEVLDLNAECSPARLRVRVAEGLALDLVLHTSDGLRQETRARGLDDTPREYNGAIEVPRATFERAGPRVRAWIDANLGGRRIIAAPIELTRTRLTFIDRCWELTLGGRPARPDVPRVPPDLGAAFAREMERRQDGRSARPC